MSANAPTVGLFVTCLIDLYRPSIGFAAITLLEQAGCRVIVPINQVCCGQPAYNNGDEKTAQTLAQQLITAFAECDYIVAASGSCLGMLKVHYPDLCKTDPALHAQATAFADKCYELTTFLTTICPLTTLQTTYPHRVTYHDSCSGLRELGIKTQPRQLLKQIKDLTLIEMPETEVCCGFGGTFCVKYADISVRLATDKINNIHQTDATILLGGDIGCLLNLAGRLKRLRSPIKVYHIAEVLSGIANHIPAIAEPAQAD